MLKNVISKYTIMEKIINERNCMHNITHLMYSAVQITDNDQKCNLSSESLSKMRKTGENRKKHGKTGGQEEQQWGLNDR